MNIPQKIRFGARTKLELIPEVNNLGDYTYASIKLKIFDVDDNNQELKSTVREIKISNYKAMSMISDMFSKMSVIVEKCEEKNNKLELEKI